MQNHSRQNTIDLTEVTRGKKGFNEDKYMFIAYTGKESCQTSRTSLR